MELGNLSDTVSGDTDIMKFAKGSVSMGKSTLGASVLAACFMAWFAACLMTCLTGCDMLPRLSADSSLTANKVMAPASIPDCASCHAYPLRDVHHLYHLTTF